MMFSLSLLFLVGFTGPISSAQSQPASSDKRGKETYVSASSHDRTLIAVRPGYGNHRTGNHYDNNRGGQWGNKTSGNKYSGNRTTSRPWTSKTTGNKYSNNRHRDGNDTSGNRQWRDHPH